MFLPITLLILAGPPQKSSPRGFRPLIPLNTPKLMECSPSLSWKNPAAKTKGITKFPKPTHRKDVLLSRKPRNQAQSNGVKHLYLFIFSHKFLCLFFWLHLVSRSYDLSPVGNTNAYCMGTEKVKIRERGRNGNKNPINFFKMLITVRKVNAFCLIANPFCGWKGVFCVSELFLLFFFKIN